MRANELRNKNEWEKHIMKHYHVTKTEYPRFIKYELKNKKGELHSVCKGLDELMAVLAYAPDGEFRKE